MQTRSFPQRHLHAKNTPHPPIHTDMASTDHVTVKSTLPHRGERDSHLIEVTLLNSLNTESHSNALDCIK